MAKTDKHIEETRHKDITQQAYRGTNEVVSGLGYGAVETKAGMLGGVVGGAAIGGIMGDRIIALEGSMKKSLSRTIEGFEKNEGTKRALLKPAEWTAKFSKWLVRIAGEAPDHLLHAMPKGWQKALKNNPRYSAGVTGAGLGALAGLVFASITGAVHGAKVANDGRKQFNDAKDEIRKLRAENQSLEGQYNALRESHTNMVNEISEIKAGSKEAANTPSTAIDAATVQTGKRREDQTLSTLPASQFI